MKFHEVDFWPPYAFTHTYTGTYTCAHTSTCTHIPFHGKLSGSPHVQRLTRLTDRKSRRLNFLKCSISRMMLDADIEKRKP